MIYWPKLLRAQEKWRPVSGFEDFYKVSNYGRVRSRTVRRPYKQNGTFVWPGRIMKLRGKTYKSVVLWGKDGRFREARIHVLVAEHFIPNPTGAKVVRHLDDDKANNYYENLAWGTHKDNRDDASRNGRSGHKLTLKTAAALKADLVKYEHRYRRKGDGGLLGIVAKKYGVTRLTVWNIRRGATWRHA